MDTIADGLRRWRHHRWLTQAQAAELLQVSLSTYHRWERGRARPDLRTYLWLKSRIGDQASTSVRRRGGGA